MRRRHGARASKEGYSICYIQFMIAAPTSLEEVAREADEATRAARARLVAAVREAYNTGMPQTEIARRIGRSQPEVSRLVRFHGTTPLARRLRRHRHEVLRIIGDAGGSKVRVFGSVATGREREGSDIDLLFHMDRPMGLMRLSRLELELEQILGVEVDLVPDSTIAPYIRNRVMSEATPL